MLMDRQRANCLRIAQSLDAGNLAVWQRASLSSAEEALVWHLVREPVAHGQRLKRAGRKTAPYSAIRADVDVGRRDPVRQADRFSPKRVETELQSSDLDFWADAPEEPEDDDDDDDDTVPCPVCNGRGRDDAGNTCEACNGTGRVPADDDDNDDDDEDDEKESLAYEYEIED
jgi:hypothetical protein